MAQDDLHIVDRLDERGLIDRWGFLLFAFGGGAAILIAKSLGVTAIPVAAGAAILMVAYAFIVQRSGTGKLRADQAGDNCYYLGLIFTLVSLAYAIFFFDPADTATTIVQGFGIALATTIMGLVLRVFFNQSRVDLVQTEDSARLELAQAAGALKAELQAITVSMNDYGRETRQSLEELRDQMVKTLGNVQDAAAKAMRETAEQATAAITEQTSEATARAKRLSTATEKVVAGIERHVTALGKIEDHSSAIAASLAALDGVAQTAARTMADIDARSASLATGHANVETVAGELREAVRELLGQVTALETTVGRFDGQVSERLDAVRAVPAEIANDIATSLQQAVATVRTQLELVASTNADTVDRLVRSAEDGAALTTRHNASLETELARSREAVSKVHGALVDMTGKLADQLS